jgi:hypothetical protein
MRRELPAEIVMKLVGHTTVGMTEYYNKRIIDESLAGLTGADTAVQKLLPESVQNPAKECDTRPFIPKLESSRS